MQPDAFEHPTRITFGADSFRQIAGLIGTRSYCVVTYGEPYFAGLTDQLAEQIGALELRTRMAQAALVAGLAFSRTKTAIAYSVSYPISLHHNVVHGIACSFTLPIVLQSVVDQDGLCTESLKQIFGADLTAALGLV